ncbi:MULTISPECIES: UPF0236 family transposase-like protein [Anoxybacillus]|uniref:Uncharacterized protein n=1 Tax=Anoxybacillus flavithermus TaxID=33934 RepID=A0A094IYZ4_9BACL|nr:MULTISPECIES: UPF0236 family protein [Anoxybacillus]KFZ32322.1 hypothetical protein JS44_11615 [Anoxybacillus flavithermus]NNU97570.1 hypothetical protein [Anoxybacillus sp. EFIL]
MRPIGSAEETMHVFAQRLKNGRSWSERGFKKLIESLVAWKDGLVLQTRKGKGQPSIAIKLRIWAFIHR